MKVIRKGKPGSEKAEPWIGKKVTCKNCKCYFELETTDKVKLEYKDRGGARIFYSVNCPGCGMRQNFSTIQKHPK